jgi:hypothetical protein
MPKALVLATRDHGATVVLEMAHHKLEIQRALLGEDADAAPALLLQAQHLRRLGVGVAVQLGPLVAGCTIGRGRSTRWCGTSRRRTSMTCTSASVA